MTLRTDTRGRVPFALVGIVLLLASAGLAVTMQPDRPASDPPVDTVMERATATTVTEVRMAVSDASAGAASAPVIHQSNTTAGRALNDSAPFREMLRVRIYHRARQRLARQRISQQGVTARASLPSTPNASALRAAKRRVDLDTVEGNETVLRVELSNVTITARRDNRTVGRQTISPTVTVRTPVLALHSGTSEFERRLDRGVARPGLAQRVTGQLYKLTWARGTAQYASGAAGGAAITNIVGSRHIEWLTNGGLLDEQRAVFGRSDAAGRRAYANATAGVAVTDLLAELPGEASRLQGLFRNGPPGSNIPAAVTGVAEGSETAGPNQEMRAGVNATADHALGAQTTGGNTTQVLQSVYSSDARLLTSVTDARELVAPCVDPPTLQARLNRNRTTVDRSVTVEESGTYTAPQPLDGWHMIDSATRAVEMNVTRNCHWETLNGTVIDPVSETTERTVGITLVTRHAHSQHAPEREIAALSGSSQFSGLNTTAAHNQAMTRLVDDAGGWDGVASKLVRGQLGTRRVAIEESVPEGLRRVALADLAGLSERVRNVSVTLDRGRASTYHVNPAGRLRQRLTERRRALLDAPSTYQSPSEKARVAVRGAYLDRVRTRLRDRYSARLDRRGRLDSILRTLGGSVDLLKRAFRNRGVQQRDRAGIEGVEVTAVDGSPPYLTTTGVGHEYVDSLEEGQQVTPLATRNVNVFTLPIADAADFILQFVGLERRVSLGTAARTLDGLDASASMGLSGSVGENVSTQRQRLRGAVERKVNVTKRRYLRRALGDAGVGDSRSERLETVEAGLAEWETTADRALAITNGSAVERIAETAVSDNETKRELVRANLRRQVYEATNARETRVPLSTVDEGAGLLREEVAGRLTDRLQNASEQAAGRVTDRIEQRLGRRVNSVPAGMPVVPTGTPWWFTTNVWYVEVRGGYERFAVRAAAGSGGEAGESLTYVRDGSPVRLDFDRDGTPERFGRADRVSFGFRTAVAIIVPPGAQGVGDKDGNMDERSSGWAEWSRVRTDVSRCDGSTGGETNTVVGQQPFVDRSCSSTRPVPPGWPTG